MRRIKTIANALIGDVTRKLSPEKQMELAGELELFTRAVNQKRDDKDKIYSLHEPEVRCIGKGKEHKKYEFGTKASIAQTMAFGVIAGALNVHNEYDGKTLNDVFSQVEALAGKRPQIAYCDRGYRGQKEIEGTKVVIPEAAPKEKTAHYKRKAREKFRRRSAIEAVNSHLKHDFRMLRGYLKGTAGDTINILMAAAAYNFKKWMRETAPPFFALLFCLVFIAKNFGYRAEQACSNT